MISNQKGFSLLESLIALAVLSVGVLGLVKLQIYIDRKADYALNSLEALQLAENKLEFFRTRANVSGGTNTLYFDDPILAEGSYPVEDIVVSGSSYTFKRSWIIEDKMKLSGASSADAKMITVDVQWNDHWGNSSNVALKTLFSRYSEFD
ncbi:prepilin-type N-terminal cleavage/methylation domain-containing protein [Photobacterium leiognathi]|uniref:type IV pilus modification PilV family protein n=1 Tax=Photobacterium leiognathi TaxID=553611 RepID=UPI001EDCEE7A|nr:prepilin-type N-terminal cleavage/methylation domain-containing protein [Photobacterium leiognathi]MCG3884692.1 prepilin-type N-terminal cleavage/methylation domain-containing protein [Photobacterium leiognathi]